MHALGQLLLMLVVGSAGGREDPRDTLACSQGLTCRLLDTDVLCGTEPPGSRHGLALARLRLEPALRCTEPMACVPCLEAHVRLALPLATSTATESHLSAQPGISGTEDSGDGGQWSPATGATSSQPNVTGLLLLSGHAYTSSRCVAVEVWAPLDPTLRGRTMGWVIFRCFEAPLGSKLHVSAYMNSQGRQRLSQQQRVPDCLWPAAQASVPQCQVPRLRVSPGQKEVVVEVQGAAVGLSYTLRLYHNHSHGTSGPGRAVTMSSPMNYVLPADEVLPCLCLQVWPETQDPLRATLCPFSHDVEAWERLWAQSRLVLHIKGQVLTCSLSAPCDLLAELVPCWQPVPSGPCQPLPGLQQPAGGQGPQEFGGLRPHPNLCVQVWSSGQVRLTQCLRDRALPGRPDDLLLLEHGGNASLCAMEWGACTPLASFTSTGAGHPGLLEQDLQQDMAGGQCQQVTVAPIKQHWGCVLGLSSAQIPAYPLGTGVDGGAAGGHLSPAAALDEEGGYERMAQIPEGWLLWLQGSAARPASTAGARSRTGGGAGSLCLDGSSALTGTDGGGSTGGWQRGCGFGATALAARPAPPGTA
ncbi:interleukin-17 receptor C isoform X2 [Cinclus cinclus]|uniref:interleukin-17 receptor C isoform X2 n=1 Tax=Cinclus cinclus TaxID=127875 RepID=UPI002E15B590